MPTVKNPDCYKCEYRGDVPGSAHSCCDHPSMKEAHDNSYAGMMAVFASVGRVPPIQAEPKTSLLKSGIKVVGDSYGINNGWFNHPWNFDPRWVKSCNGFKEIPKS
jgi:hypothetical protein